MSTPAGLPGAPALTYCSTDQARAAGLDPAASDVAALAAVREAMDRVDRYTSEWFTTRGATLVEDVPPNGLVMCSKHLQAVTAVRLPGVSTPLVASAYRVLPELDAVQVLPGYTRAYDDLVVGAESYSGGWANLYSWTRTGDLQQVELEGLWGLELTPEPVRRATARLAALIFPAPMVGAADAEGNPTGVPAAPVAELVTPAQALPTKAEREQRSTGDAMADQLLYPYRRDKVLVG